MTLEIRGKHDLRRDTKNASGASTVSKNAAPIHLALAGSVSTSKASEFKEWEEVKKEQDDINIRSSNEDKVVTWHKLHAAENNNDYVVVDKQKGILKVYSADGRRKALFEVGVGKQVGDEFISDDAQVVQVGGLKKDIRTITDKDLHSTKFSLALAPKTEIAILPQKEGGSAEINHELPIVQKAHFETTAAGIYTVNRQGTGKDKYNKMYGNNIFTLYTDRGSSGVSIHQIPIGGKQSSERMKKLYDGDTSNNRFSEGGINMLDVDFNELEKYVKSGTKVYVLPEDPNNKIVAKNGQLNMVQKEFTGLVLTSKKNRTAQQLKIDEKTERVQKPVIREFASALVNKKPELMQKLGLDNDTYNNLAGLSLGIAGQESNFGEDNWYQFKEDHPTATSVLKVFRPAYRWAKGLIKGNKHASAKKSTCTVGCESRGLTQIKLGEQRDPEVVALLKSYGITKENPDVLNSPTKSAIATMILITNMYKNELPSVKRIRKELHRKDISDLDAISYMWHGRKDQLIDKKEDVEPNNNIYVKNVRKFLAGNFTLSQTNRPTEVELPKETEQVAAPSAAESETEETK